MVNRLGWSLLAFLFLVSVAEAGGRYDNRKYGFTITSPDKWSRIPAKPTEKWIVARFKSNRSYPTPDGWSEHSPVIKVILFPNKTETGTGSLGKTEGEKEKPKVTITFVNPFKNYKDYLKGNFSGGGYFISNETQGKQGGTPVTRLEIKVEKLAQYGEQRIITWVFHAPIGDFAVQVDILESKYAKVAPLVLGALKSFRIIKRDSRLADTEEDQIDGPIVLELGKELTPAERKQKRIDYTEKIFKKAKQDLPPGWKVFNTKHFLVIYHTSTAKAQRYANQAEVFRCWLNKNFDKIGEEHVCRCILRVCKNWEEEKTYRSASSGAWSFSNREITTNVSGDDRQSEFEYINTTVLHKFFSDKNELLWRGLPYWLERGLDQYLGTAIASGKRLNFKPDSWEKECLRTGRREGRLMDLKELMLSTSKESGNDWDDQRVFRAQCGSIVRFLFGPGRRGRTKGIVYKYIDELMTILIEKEKEEEKRRAEARKKAAEEGDDEPMTEEEEEEAYKKRKEGQSNEAWYAEKRKILKQCMDKTFKGWSDRDWKIFDISWSKWAK
ncbi:MAG: hypothetical protein ACYTFG_20565 [Planctomycetota bacterium]|jgi:hypothetical protein